MAARELSYYTEVLPASGQNQFCHDLYEALGIVMPMGGTSMGDVMLLAHALFEETGFDAYRSLNISTDIDDVLQNARDNRESILANAQLRTAKPFIRKLRLQPLKGNHSAT